ncbi:MAG: GIY-YIG nuclease family protein [Lachnospiraceae bacterium]|nr:GIY-YIG nuclease family protein [Lachnospiraceae bacterium]
MGFFDIFKASKYKEENENLKKEIANLTNQISTLGITEYCQTKEKIALLEKESNARLSKTNAEIDSNNTIIAKLRDEISTLQEQNNKLSKSVSSQEKKLSRIKELYKSTDYALKNFFNSEVSYTDCKLSTMEFEELESICPSVILKLHCMDVKSLRKAYKENEKQIDDLLKQYSARYTTKANKSIYNLMVIALRAELQNILYNLKYEKLDKSIEDIKKVSAKYLQIAGEGNQSIAGTLTKFIGEIEYLFINAAKIEYNYYVKKEQARQEQLAIKEQMRQEAEERKALEAERKKIEKEESKFESQISALTEQANSAEGDELETLKARILELQSQLANVVVKKEEIASLQNGKAGNVYIISNLGSFGDNVFKVGMTRRLDPQDRVNELGDASVPFKFDVHSFIFSDDASTLETELHKRLHDKRVNKVNLRKEFFNITIEELEELVMEICPTAEFNKTMLAEEFRQSQSSSEVYSSDYELEDLDDE